MKNLLYLFLVVALAFGLTSCEKEELEIENEISEQLIQEKENSIDEIFNLAESEIIELTETDIMDIKEERFYLDPEVAKRLIKEFEENKDKGLESNFENQVRSLNTGNKKTGKEILLRSGRVNLKGGKFYTNPWNIDKSKMNSSRRYFGSVYGDKKGVAVFARGSRTKNSRYGHRTIRSNWSHSRYAKTYMRKSDLRSYEVRGKLLIYSIQYDQLANLSFWNY